MYDAMLAGIFQGCEGMGWYPDLLSPRLWGVQILVAISTMDHLLPERPVSMSY